RVCESATGIRRSYSRRAALLWTASSDSDRSSKRSKNWQIGGSNMEPILGGLLGGVARLAPEILKFFDRRNERKHELALAEHQLELIRVQHHTRMDEITAG